MDNSEYFTSVDVELKYAIFKILGIFGILCKHFYSIMQMHIRKINFLTPNWYILHKWTVNARYEVDKNMMIQVINMLLLRMYCQQNITKKTANANVIELEYLINLTKN